MITFRLWYEKHTVGKQLLGLLGDTEAQQEILGHEYERVLLAIEGTDARPPLANLGSNRMGQKRGQDAMAPGMSKKVKLF